MKFQEAFDKAFEMMKKEDEKKGRVFVIAPGTARILAFLWSMLAIAKNVLDDTAMIDDNNDIVSIPLNNKKSTTDKDSSGKTKQVKSVEDNVKEPQEKP